MISKVFLINKLSEFVDKFPFGRARYEFHGIDSSHYIIVEPSALYRSDVQYREWESKLENDFEREYPNEFLCIAEDFPYSQFIPDFDTNLFSIPSTYQKSIGDFYKVDTQGQIIVDTKSIPTTKPTGEGIAKDYLCGVMTTGLLAQDFSNVTYAMAA
ncbi:MAG: hypothetical protein QM743_13645 [Chitinophagaceae bacterium]